MNARKYADDPRLGARTYASADRDWHIDAALTEISIQYTLDPSKFIAPQVLPAVSVGKQSDKYFIWDKAFWFRIPQTQRAKGTAPKFVEFGVSSAGYFAENYMLGGRIPYEDLTNADQALALEDSIARGVTQLLMLDQENRVATLLTTAANAGSGTALTGTARWDDYGNSAPISDVTTGKAWMRLATGQTPNTLVVGAQVHDALLQHPDMIDRIKYVARADQAVIAAAIADIFGVQKYLVGEAVYNSAAEGLAASMAYVWGKNATLLYVPPTPGLLVPSAGYSFRWKPEGFTDFVVETKENDDIKAREKRVGYFQDEVITASDLLYIISTVVN